MFAPPSLQDASSPPILLGTDPAWWQIIALAVVSLLVVTIIIWRGRSK